MMRFGRYLSILGVAAILTAAAPSVLAAPTEQVYVPGAGLTVPTAYPGLLRDLQMLYSWQDFQGNPLQVVALDGGAYLVANPNLFWPANATATAQAVANQLDSMDPGWGTTVANGPLGYGAYLTYRPSAYAGYTPGFLRAIQQTLPWQTFQGAPLQVAPLDATSFVVSSPSLFWPASNMAAAQAVAYQLASAAPGWGTTLYNGPQGYGVYLTYQPWAYAGIG